MPRFLNTKGNRTLGIGICDRCKMKFPLDKLMPDPNTPGLRVCEKDRDTFDPWRLPARQPEKITLPFVRSDDPLVTNPLGIISEDGDMFLITEEGDEYLLP